MLLSSQPLWPLEYVRDATWSPLYVEVDGAVLEVDPHQLANPDVHEVDLHIGAKAAIDPFTELVDLVDLPVSERALRVSCPKRLLLEAMLVEVVLPEGGRIVWQLEQVELLQEERQAALGER